MGSDDVGATARGHLGGDAGAAQGVIDRSPAMNFRPQALNDLCATIFSAHAVPGPLISMTVDWGPTNIGATAMQVFIENEAGSRRKNIYDERTLRYVRTVDVSASYPYPYGFVIGTVSGDDESVDCFVLTAEPVVAGTTLE